MDGIVRDVWQLIIWTEKQTIEKQELGTNAGKQRPLAATDV
jgi:hypothetical protein